MLGTSLSLPPPAPRTEGPSEPAEGEGQLQGGEAHHEHTTEEKQLLATVRHQQNSRSHQQRTEEHKWELEFQCVETLLRTTLARLCEANVMTTASQLRSGADCFKFLYRIHDHGWGYASH